MSRSNPSENTPNPATRFFEWNGEHGNIRYYDKTEKKNIDVTLPFTFLLLDELASVRGWHDPSQSGIYSNEVRDTRTDIMVVKAFKEGVLAEGLYKSIKDRVNAQGGQFNANCYLAYKRDRVLVIGSLQLKGAALGAWMEFRKANRSEIYDKAIVITGFVEGKKGKVIFRVPTFEMKDAAPETNETAVELDKQLQEYLTAYFGRTTSDKAVPNGDHVDAPPVDDAADDFPVVEDNTTFDDNDIPFSWLLPFILPVLVGASALLC